MSTTATDPGLIAPASHQEILERFGFEPEGAGFRAGEVRLDPVGAGWRFAAPWPQDRDPLADPGLPGLWRCERLHDAACQVFALPGWLLDGADPVGDMPDGEPDWQDGQRAFAAAVAWVVATARGALPQGWAPPGDPVQGGWFPAAALTIQQGGVLRQVELQRAEDRFALRLVLAEAVPAELPEIRREYLRRILLETQARWLLVRTAIGVDDTPTAVVDLSGVPDALARPLCLAGLESLRRVAAHLVEAVEFLAFSDAGNEALSLSRQK